MTVAEEAGIGYGYANVGDRATGWYVGRIRYQRNDRAGIGYGYATVFAPVPPHTLATDGGLGENEFGEDG